MRLTTLAVAAVSLLSFVAFAQEARAPLPPKDNGLRPPQVLIHEKDGDKALTLAKADIQVLIAGYLAQTTITLTFQNDQNRVLEGELVFPLPEGASISGYGLDLNGEMVDGVPVEKEKARVTFETEVRKGVDPGLVEHVKGNAFRTRLYPIPAKGSRTVKVQWNGDLIAAGTGAAYTLPLNWGDQVKEGSIKVEVVAAPGEPKIEKAVVDKFDFQKTGDRYVAERKFQNVKFIDDLVIALPQVAREHAVVEKFTPSTEEAKSEFFFAINDQPNILLEPMARAKVSKLGIAWDASLSRAEADKQREYELLAKALKDLGDVQVDLIVFRNVVEKPVSFKIEKGDASKLIEHLKGLVYDGGTNLGLLQFADKECGYYLWFTDGIGNLGPEMPAKIEVPVYAISNETTANHTLLKYVGQTSGGGYFNLKRMTDEQVAGGIGTSQLSLIGLEYKEGEVAEVYPKGSGPVIGRMPISGKLLVAESKVTLKYGVGAQVLHTTAFTLKQANAAKTGLVAKAWAGRKVDDLTMFADKNHNELLALGQQFGIVTPNTSLMVLERLEQYVQYKITPPKSRSQVYAAYMEQMKTQQVEAKKVEQQKIDRIVALWQGKVKWWETEFKYPKGFRYVEPATRPAAPPADGIDIAGGTALPPVAPLVHDPRAPAAVDEERTLELRQGLMGETGLKAKEPGGQPSPSITIKAWDPDTPYLRAMKSTTVDKAYAACIDQRKGFAASPAFYLDCGDWLLKNNQKDLGIRVLTDVAELQLDSAPLLRIVAHKLAQAGERDLAIDLFEKILKLRPEEPQSYRDLAQVLAERADDYVATWNSRRPAKDYLGMAAADYQRALDMLHHVVMNQWQRFDEIELIALMEANRLIAKVGTMQPSIAVKNPLDSRLVRNLDCDVRILLTWDADLTDIDLWVTEPSSEKCFYGHNRTTIGGAMSKDFTQGYGPEEYCLRKMMAGVYKIQCNYYGSSQQTVSGPCTVQATVITNFGRADEKRQYLTLRLTEKKETVDIGEVKLGE